jgi:3-methylcrotonyl-CoA carboxylase alpha subunit
VFTKILIANRGEIACRIVRTARRLGVATVAVYSDADANARHVRIADEAVRIGPPPARESYLSSEAILDAARRTGAQAIHPGYGFLSENAAFAQACVDAGIQFIGPPASAIRAMGSKSAAKTLMQRAGIPLVPGYHGEEQAPAALQREADRIGYPVLIKASAGGGGKGMRVVDRAADFAAALASCQREAAASFGDARVLLEKYLLRPRHIEIQIFFDAHGHGVHLFERDCSVQRRHQKVLEEAPAPGMDDIRREQMGRAALAAAAAVGYVGAGTVEFIAEPNGAFYFMEMNTRLQVEHPVTEMITGLDLVEWQLRVASGEILPLQQDQLKIHGHAIEARLYAEDPDRDFLPSTGRLVHLKTPVPSADIRLDAGVEEGDDITPYYDPMIAKLIVWGETRETARARMLGALREFQIVGVSQNVPFLSRLVATPAFASADLDTSLIERERARLFPKAKPVPEDVFVVATLEHLRLQQPRGEPAASVWRVPDRWRLNATSEQTLLFQSQGAETHVMVRFAAEGLQVEINGTALPASLMSTSATDRRLMRGGHVIEASIVVHGERTHVFLNGEHYLIELMDPLAHVGEQVQAEGNLRAITPGRVVALLAKPGARVLKGAPLVILEAMKMEHTTRAPEDGVCESFNVVVGDLVAEGSELVKFIADSARETNP